MRKTCRKCGRARAASCFHYDRTRKDGLAVWCRDCVSAKTAAWAAKNRADLFQQVFRQRVRFAEIVDEKESP